MSRAARWLRSATWFGPTDARPLALLRIVLGLLLIADWLDRLRDLFAFMSPTGIVPPGRAPGLWSVFDWCRSPAGIFGVEALGLVAIVAFTCGYRTRVATLLTWVFATSVQHRNLLVCDSGDTLARMLLFWGLFVDLGARFSLDVALGHRPPARWISVLGVRFMQMQVAIMYLCTAWAKSGSSWMDGTAIARAVVNEDFGRPSGVWLAAIPWFCHFMTRATLAIEWGFSLLVFSSWGQPWVRRGALLAGVLLHLGIFVFMKVGFFSLFVVASYLAFVDAGMVDRAARRLPILRAEGGEWHPPPPLRAQLLGAVLVTQLLVIVHAQIHRASRLESIEMYATATWQDWHMFAPNPPALSYRFTADGVDASDRPVDVLAAAAPLFGAHGAYQSTRWNKLRVHLAMGADAMLPILGRYLCERYDGASRPPLKSVSVYADVVALPVANLPAGAREQRHMLYLKHSCETTN